MIKAVCVLSQSKTVTGTIYFSEQSNNTVKITGIINGLCDGLHGFHIHNAGDLTDHCKSACAHFNPTNSNHGGKDSKIRHAGDLGNIRSKNNVAKINITDKIIKLRGTKYNIIGRSVVVHANPDDLGLGTGDARQESLVTGNAGARLACGVIGYAAH